MGGAQSLHTNSMDEAMALPTEKAARIARRTQQVIAYETNVAHVADPLGGSWFVEELTDKIEELAEVMFAEISEMGHGSMLEGCIQGIEENWFQGRIADSAYELERAFNAGHRIVVGANRFREGNEDESLELLRISQEQEKEQRSRLATVRSNRNEQSVREARLRLEKDASDPEMNLMPALIDAANSYVTLGEMMSSLGDVFGRHIEVPVI
jgi:methylmalonyl-CoA mutase N-terminal domain/subunit